MLFQPDSPLPKSRGDNLRSKDWNDLIEEVRRLDTDKVNRADDAMTGSLTIDGHLGVGTTAPQGLFDVKGELTVKDDGNVGR